MLLCAQLPRASVVHLLFHVSPSLARRDWTRLLSALPDFRDVAALRASDADVRTFLRSLMSLEAFRGEAFVDCVESDGEGDAHRTFVQFSMASRTPLAFCRWGDRTWYGGCEVLRRHWVRGLRFSWNQLAILGDLEIKQWRFEMPLQVAVVRECGHDAVLPCFRLGRGLCVLAPCADPPPSDDVRAPPAFLPRRARFQKLRK